LSYKSIYIRKTFFWNFLVENFLRQVNVVEDFHLEDGVVGAEAQVGDDENAA